MWSLRVSKVFLGAVLNIPVLLPLKDRMHSVRPASACGRWGEGKPWCRAPLLFSLCSCNPQGAPGGGCSLDGVNDNNESLRNMQHEQEITLCCSHLLRRRGCLFLQHNLAYSN